MLSWKAKLVKYVFLFLSFLIDILNKTQQKISNFKMYLDTFELTSYSILS